MIVNYKDNKWEIITQRSHGLLAAQICARWKISDQPKEWVETLVATAEHDDVFNELERLPLINDKGGPIDFKSEGFNAERSAQLIDRAEMKSSLIALLIYRHIEFTHGEDAAAQKFLTSLATRKSKWMKVADVKLKDLNAAYELLEFCDAFSLLICQSLIPPEGRSIEISTGPKGNAFSVHQRQKKLIVSPWPFEPETFDISFETRILSDLTYTSDEALKADIRQARVRKEVLSLARH